MRSPVFAPNAAVRRFEAGIQFGGMRTGQPLNCYFGCPTAEPFTGLSGSFNVNPYLAIDSSLGATGNTPYDQGYDSYRMGGHASEFLFGAKGTVRGSRSGFFGTAEPGLLSWSHVLLDRSFVATPAPAIVPTFGRRNSFVFDLGGGVEYSPRPRTRVRIEISDLVVQSNNAFTSNIEGTRYVIASNPWLNELQATGSVSWAFGKPIVWTPPDIHEKPSHRFFDKTNIALLTVGLLGQASDAVTTQRAIERGCSEGDPLSAPFVERGWPGQIAIGVLDNAAQLSIMYALHRMHHHRIERLVPIGRAAIGGMQGYRNDRRE
jgi:hypothetical protein